MTERETTQEDRVKKYAEKTLSTLITHLMHADMVRKDPGRPYEEQVEGDKLYDELRNEIDRREKLYLGETKLT